MHAYFREIDPPCEGFTICLHVKHLLLTAQVVSRGKFREKSHVSCDDKERNEKKNKGQIKARKENRIAGITPSTHDY